MRNPRTKRLLLAFEAGEEKHRAMSNESHHRLESFVDGACVLIHRSRQEGGRGGARAEATNTKLHTKLSDAIMRGGLKMFVVGAGSEVRCSGCVFTRYT